MNEVQKVAVITGASQGIGAGLVDAYRKLGYAVVANSRTIAPVRRPGHPHRPGRHRRPRHRRTRRRRRRSSGSAVSTPWSTTPGIFIAKPFTDYTEEDYATVVGREPRPASSASPSCAVARMLDQGGGHIVNITTSLVDNANASVPSVLASLTKGGLQSATKSLAIEYAARGIRVNAVSPGTIKTPMHPEETHEALAALHPVGRMGEIERHRRRA